jgi:hypothetical protein
MTASDNDNADAFPRFPATPAMCQNRHFFEKDNRYIVSSGACWVEFSQPVDWPVPTFHSLGIQITIQYKNTTREVKLR